MKGRFWLGGCGGGRLEDKLGLVLSWGILEGGC